MLNSAAAWRLVFWPQYLIVITLAWMGQIKTRVLKGIELLDCALDNVFCESIDWTLPTPLSTSESFRLEMNE